MNVIYIRMDSITTLNKTSISMKTYLIIFIFLLFLCDYAICQTSNSYFTRRIELNQIYNKKTGKLIPEKEILELQKTNKLHFESVINKYGEVDHYEVDLNRRNVYSTRDTAQRVKKGDVFLPFVMKSISNKTLDSEKLKGQYTLLQFQISFKEPFFIEKFFNEFDEIISEYKGKKDINVIFITQSSAKESNDRTSDKSYNFEIVPDGRNFEERYLITKYPTMILLGLDGNLISYYNLSEINKLKADLNKLN